MSSANENLNPQVLRAVAKEITKLAATPMDGIKVHINEDDISDIQATIYGPEGTPFEGGQFRMKLVLSADYPTAPPKGFFITKIFHPNVAANGAICVNTLKKDWKSDMGIENILIVVRCLLIDPNPASALNEEAGKLLLEAYDEYARRAKMMTEIHARPKDACAAATTAEADGPAAKKRAVVAAATDKKAVEKKRNLKRL